MQGSHAASLLYYIVAILLYSKATYNTENKQNINISTSYRYSYFYNEIIIQCALKTVRKTPTTQITMYMLNYKLQGIANDYNSVHMVI